MDDQVTKADASARPKGPVWLTYVELGERLKITPDAARQKAIRGRYRKQKGNDGKARVLVEPEVLEIAVQTQPPTNHTDDHPDERMDAVEPVQTQAPPPSSGIDATLAAMLDEQIGFLRGLVESERARADRLQEELLSLAKTHTNTLERHAAEVRQLTEHRRGWWPWRRRA
jgi:hypothetical protein